MIARQHCHGQAFSKSTAQFFSEMMVRHCHIEGASLVVLPEATDHEWRPQMWSEFDHKKGPLWRPQKDQNNERIIQDGGRVYAALEISIKE